MAYNNAFPVGYQNYYPPYSMATPISTPNAPTAPANPGPSNQMQTNLIWVQGEAGAKSYLIAPNTTVQLWDSESQTIYLKSADGSGMPSMKILDYTIRDNGQSQSAPVSAQNAPNFDDYVTKDELHTLEQKLYKRLDKIAYRNKRNEEVEDDE